MTTDRLGGSPPPRDLPPSRRQPRHKKVLRQSATHTTLALRRRVGCSKAWGTERHRAATRKGWLLAVFGRVCRHAHPPPSVAAGKRGERRLRAACCLIGKPQHIVVPKTPNTSSQKFSLTGNKLSVILKENKALQPPRMRPHPARVGAHKGLYDGTRLERVPSFFLCTYLPSRGAHRDLAYIYSCCSDRDRSGCLPRGASEVSEGAVADKLPCKPQKLSGTGWHPVEILEDNAPEARKRHTPREEVLSPLCAWALARFNSWRTVHRGRGSIRWEQVPPERGVPMPETPTTAGLWIEVQARQIPARRRQNAQAETR
jgi:hypothetical protein